MRTTTSKRARRKQPGDQSENHGRFDRFLLSFMGPPAVGDVNAPSTVHLDPAIHLCGKCGRAWDDHEVVRTSNVTYARCPEDQEQAATDA